MKIILTLFLISFYVTGADFTSIPKQYKNKIYLDEPKKNTITINDSLRIKGQVTKEIRVKINSEEIQLKNYQFDKSLKLSQLGKQNIIIEFLINEDRIILEREVIKLKDSKDEVLSQRQLAFINTNFTSNRFKQLPLQNALQKSEVAYFLDKININPSTETISILNAEKIKNHSSAIQNLVNSKVFNLNDNGDFNEFETMAKTTFLASISKALNLVPSGINYPALKEYKNAWFYNYLVIGFDQQLINKNDLKSIRKTMTNADFVRIASKIKLFENAIAKELTFSPTKIIASVIEESQSEIKVLKKSNQVQVNINEVKQVSKTTKKIFGKINQDVPFTINYRKVSANSDGSFDFLLPLNQDQIVVTFLNQKFIKDVSLNPRKEPVIVKQPVIEEFQDLKNHWVKDIANKLKASGKLDNTSNFDPNAKISRADLAKYLVKINDLKTKVGAQDLTFSDVSKNDKDYAYIQAVTKNKLMKGMSKTTYDKNSNVTRIQALIVASRLLPDKENASNTSLPFQDISKYKWATKNIRKAYDYKLISPSSKLNPKQEITRAELITLLFRASNA